MPYHIAGGGRDPRVELKHEEILEPIDGDYKKLELKDTSLDGKYSVTFSGGYGGRPVDPTYMPTRLRRKGNEGRPLHDVRNIWGGGLLVTERFKGIVECFEAGVHQFFPIQIEQRGKVIADRYIFYVCNRLDTLAKDLCVPPVAEGAKYMPAYDGNDRMVFDAKKIGAHHAWNDRFTIGRMVSNELFDALAAADFTGLGFEKFDQI